MAMSRSNKKDAEDVVEITPEMMAAGAKIICYGSEPGQRYAPAGCEPDSPEETAVAIYRAMEAVRLRHS
jgi:hypothetical protein